MILSLFVIFPDFDHGLSPYLAAENKATSAVGSLSLVDLPYWTFGELSSYAAVDPTDSPKSSFFRSQICEKDLPCPGYGQDDLTTNRLVVPMVSEDQQGCLLALRLLWNWMARVRCRIASKVTQEGDPAGAHKIGVIPEIGTKRIRLRTSRSRINALLQPSLLPALVLEIRSPNPSSIRLRNRNQSGIRRRRSRLLRLLPLQHRTKQSYCFRNWLQR